MRSPSSEVVEFFKAGPGGVPTQTAFSQSARWPSLDGDRATGCIRDLEHAFSRERRPGRALRQYRAGWLRGENRRG